MNTYIIIRQAKRMMKHFSFFILLFSFLLASCNRDTSHIVVPQSPDPDQPQGGGAVVGLNTDNVTNTKFEDTHLYGFNAEQRMILHRYYATQQELSSDLFTLDQGAYTFVAVLNVGEAFAPTIEGQAALAPSRADAPLHDISLSQLLGYVKQTEASYPDMLTGMINRTITTGEVVRVEIPLADNAGGIAMTAVTVDITLPDAEFETYQAARTRATAPHNLRGVVEFYRKGTKERVLRHEQVLTPVSAGKYALTAEVSNGDYDMALWVDYSEEGSTTDLWYHTPSLQAVRLIATDKTYTSGSDTRETFYGMVSLTADGTANRVEIAAVRPQAKYVLIANDIERYRELMVANLDKYVPLSDLSVHMVYESYLPDGFNVLDGKPNSSQQGYKTNKVALPAIGAEDREVRIASDYVFVNGAESSVTVTVLVTDKTGRTVSRVQGVVVKYKRNMLTTVTADFLTAGVVNPGINIDTDWDGVHEVEF